MIQTLFPNFKVGHRFLGLLFIIIFFNFCHPLQVDTKEKASDPLTAEQSSELKVLTYNLYMRGPQLFFWNKQRKRTKLLPKYLEGYDVIVFQEVFMNKNRKRLLKEISHYYPYQTKILKKNKSIKQNGGVIIISRWPIEEEAQQIYSECAGLDCIATKGVIYARINKRGVPYHIFGTHTQASDKHRKTRAQQFEILHAFIDEQHIDSTEPVIIVGDLNVNLYSNSKTGEYSKMLEILMASHPQPRPGPDYAPTFDGNNNKFVNTKITEYFDYLLYSDRHLQPDSSFNEVKIFQDDGFDLSDHYAVYGFFSF